GFSRGAIACSYIALRDQAMADIWAGFLPHGQHDGGSYTPDPGNVRLGRIAGRPSIITYGDNDDGLPNCVNGFNILTNLGFPVVSYMLPNLDHTDEWILDTAPPEHLAVREILRQWLVDTIANKPGTHSISGQVTDAFGNAIDHAKVQSGQTHWTFTDSNGYYTLAGLINSDRTLTAQWGEFQSEPRNVTINGMDLAEEDFTLVTHECSEPIQGDINDDCKVDMQDIAIIAINWLKCNRVPADLCY
ncbi:MAG: carboxypeptidase regulatory-like domain-containing protein, partial [Anaerohalosphaera sp.]|nr:carboxypeptidase regulatory-like domain-containing protein [Anaerohalosphaera sp.]